MSSRFDGRYESDGSDYEEYSGDDKTDSGTEYLTESEHELSSHSSDDQDDEDDKSDGNEDASSFSEPEPEADDKATEAVASEEEDKLGKMFDEWRRDRKPQQLDIDELEKVIDQSSNDDEKEETNNKPDPELNTGKSSLENDDKNKDESEKTDSSNGNPTTVEKDNTNVNSDTVDKDANNKDTDLSTNSQYPQEILDFLKNKENKKEESKLSDSSKNIDNDDDYDENTSDETEQENKIGDDDKSTNYKNEGRDGNRHHSRHLYTHVTMPTRRTYWISAPQAEKHNWSCKDRPKLITLRPQGKFGHREYRIIAREMEKTRRRHLTGNYSGFDIVKIQKVVNPCLWRRFRLSRKEIKIQNEGDSNEKILFHGSPAWRSLIATGFDERYSAINGMFGAGLYFAENSSKSNQYVFGFSNGNRCPAHEAKNCLICERVLLLCRVSLGKVKEVTDAVKLPHAPAHHHAVMAVPRPGGLLYCEYVIYRGEQAYPEYVITYKLKP